MSEPDPTDKALSAVNRAADIVGIEKTSKLDNLRNLLLASMSGIPLIGGPLATLAENYIPKQKEKRLIEFVERLSEDISAAKDQIRTEVVTTDSFAFVFEKTLRGVLDSWQQDKIDCFRAVLLNTLTGKVNLSDEEREIFLQLLDSLTVRHLRIMGVLLQNNTGNRVEVVRRAYPAYDGDSINYIMDDLRNKGLVHAKNGVVDDPDLNTNFNQLSTMGKQFLEFITR